MTYRILFLACVMFMAILLCIMTKQSEVEDVMSINHNNSFKAGNK